MEQPMYAGILLQADFLLFSSGVVFFTLSVMVLTLGQRRLKMGWAWLAAFGTLLSLSRMFALLGQVVESHPHFVVAGIVSQILAFLALLQFACSGTPLSRRLFVFGLVVPQVAAVVVGVLQRFPGPDAVSLGTLELIAGLWAGIRIFMGARQEPADTRFRFRLAGILLGCCGILWGAPILINGTFYPLFQPPDRFETGFQCVEPLVAAAFVGLLTMALGADASATKPNQRSLRSCLMVWSLPALALCLAGSVKLVALAGDVGSRSQREVRLSRVRTAVSAVNADWVRDLSGSPADTGKSSYSNLCDQLRKIWATDRDTRFVYLMSRTNDQVVFLAESEPDTSPDHSPPGQVYAEAPDSLRRLFDHGQAFVEMPLRDRWGEWESAFAPIRADSKTVLAVLGMDMDVRLSRRFVAQHRLAGIGLSLTLYLLMLGLFTGLHVSRQSAREAAASENRFRTMFENAPEAVFVFQADSGKILAANPFMADWLGYSGGEMHGKTVQDLVCGTLDQIRSRILPGSGADRAAPEDFVFRRKDGRQIPAEATGDALRFQEADGMVVFARDVADRRLAESELRKRGALLNGLAEAARILLTGENVADAIHQALAAMGRAAGVDAAYVFENHMQPETGEPVATRRFIWRNEALPEDMTPFSDLHILPYSRFQRWLAEFSGGRAVQGSVRAFPQPERELLDRYGVRSLVTIPIMMDGRLWGFIGFEDCRFEREWSEAEISIVRAAASSIGGAIKRRDAEERLQKSLSELKRFNRLMVGRETRVVELKREINGLLRELNRPAAYSSVACGDSESGKGAAR
jgi:PAS domain S-box-containing protein